MYLEEDFSKEYEEEMQELKEICENHKDNPQKEAERAEELEFIKKVVYAGHLIHTARSNCTSISVVLYHPNG